VQDSIAARQGSSYEEQRRPGFAMSCEDRASLWADPCARGESGGEQRESQDLCYRILLCCTLKRRSGAQAEPRRHQPANLSWSAPDAHIIAPRQIKAKNDLKVLKYVEPKAPMVSSSSTGRDQNA